VSVLAVIVCLILGVDPRVVFQGSRPDEVPTEPRDPQAQAQQKKFVSVVLADTEDVWHELFRKMGRPTRSRAWCSSRAGAVRLRPGERRGGPFYCPGDSQVYIDLQFFEDLKQRFRAPGDFAQAYVIAHEIGHHVQNLLGISRGSTTSGSGCRRRSTTALRAPGAAGRLPRRRLGASRAEDEADPAAGRPRGGAAGRQRDRRRSPAAQSAGYVVPDAFTHGTSSQRARWFRLGFETGNVGKMDELFSRPYNEL
jgi:predicted metalloprotease